jgi:subtilisin-like proprotein convertase family protein
MKAVVVAFASMLAIAAVPASAQVYNGAGFQIGDLTTHSSTISVSDSGTVSGVDFTLNDLTHTYINDLYATLTHDGVTVAWLNHTGGSADLRGTYTISDAGLTTLGGGSGDPRPSGVYDALSTLTAFNGTSVAGDWTLTIADQVGADAGNLDSWTLHLNGVQGAVPEPATWAMMLLGFAGIGVAMRRRRSSEHLPQLA